MSEEKPAPAPEASAQDVAAVAALMSSLMRMARHPGSAVVFVVLALPPHAMTETTQPTLNPEVNQLRRPIGLAKQFPMFGG